MRKETVILFHELLKKGYLDRLENENIWNYLEDNEVLSELSLFKEEIGFETYRVGKRFYLIPKQDNDLFLKNNIDYRRDLHVDSSVRLRDLYLFNYLAIYILYLFFNGEGSNPLTRDFIAKSALIREFTKHCAQAAENKALKAEGVPEYSANFIQLAQVWLSKAEGESTSFKLDEKYGVLNRLLNKFKTDELFLVKEDDLLYPTRKLKDLMPYFLRKERIIEINAWLKKEDENAADQQDQDR